MNRTSLFLKLFLGNFLLVGLVFLVAGVVSYRSISERYAGDVANHQDRLTAIAQQYIEHLWPLPTRKSTALNSAGLKVSVWASSWG